MTSPYSPTVASARPASLLDLSPMVLLAENDRALRDRLRETLELDHLRVLSATNGQEALAVAESWMPDLLVTDVAMPRLDGFELIRAIRCLYPGLPVIVSSGDPVYRERPLATVAAELGVDATLLKPFDLGDLSLAVRRALRPHADSRPVPDRMGA